MSLSAKSDEQQRIEVYVLRAAKELAKSHICDAIQATIDKLSSIKWGISPGHEGKCLSDEVKAAGVLSAARAMENILDDAPIEYRDMVNAANEDSEIIDEDTVQDDLRNYVAGLMQEWENG